MERQHRTVKMIPQDRGADRRRDWAATDRAQHRSQKIYEHRSGAVGEGVGIPAKINVGGIPRERPSKEGTPPLDSEPQRRARSTSRRRDTPAPARYGRDGDTQGTFTVHTDRAPRQGSGPRHVVVRPSDRTPRQRRAPLIDDDYEETGVGRPTRINIGGIGQRKTVGNRRGGSRGDRNW